MSEKKKALESRTLFRRLKKAVLESNPDRQTTIGQGEGVMAIRRAPTRDYKRFSSIGNKRREGRNKKKKKADTKDQ